MLWFENNESISQPHPRYSLFSSRPSLVQEPSSIRHLMYCERMRSLPRTLSISMVSNLLVYILSAAASATRVVKTTSVAVCMLSDVGAAAGQLLYALPAPPHQSSCVTISCAGCNRVRATLNKHTHCLSWNCSITGCSVLGTWAR